MGLHLINGAVTAAADNEQAQGSLLTLRQRISSFAAPHVQQFGRADLEVTAEADIQSQHILLVQG